MPRRAARPAKPEPTDNEPIDPAVLDFIKALARANARADYRRSRQTKA